jgi:hypothetical protein
MEFSCGEEIMKMKIQNKTLAALAVATAMTIPVVASAQNITSRTTQMNWDSLYGGGPTIFEPSDSFISSTMESNFSNSMGFTDSQTGDFPIGWTAAVDIDINQSFSITGPLTNFTSISADMDGFKNQSASGIGSAGIGSNLPGNSLIFEFDVATTMNYSLTGSLYYDPNGAFENSVVSIQTFNGVFWTGIPGATTSQLGNNQNFNFSGTLAAGSYRIFSSNTLPGGFSSYQGSNNYTFTNLDAVPEPGTLLVVGAAALFARKKRK